MTIIIQGSDLLEHLAQRDEFLWSAWRAEGDDPVRLAREAAQHDRLDVEPERLPWRVGETVGQVWGQLYCGELLAIDHIGCESAAERYRGPPRPVPYLAPMLGAEQCGDRALGVWEDGRFVVDHYVRLDHLPAELRRRWLTEVRIPWLEAERDGRLPVLASLRVSRLVSADPSDRAAILAEIRRELAATQAEAERLANGERTAVVAPALEGPARVVQGRLL